MMNRIFLLLMLSLQVFSFSSHAVLMKYSFTGKITEVENEADIVWATSTTIGQDVSGYFLLDTEIVKGGREETSYYWWHNIDDGPGALTSAVRFAGFEYQLTSDFDFLPMYGAWGTDEFIEYFSGIDLSLPVPEKVADGITLRDQEKTETQVANGVIDFDKELSFGFFDSINDFLTDFRYIPGESEPQPDWTQTFEWEDDGQANNGKSSGGSFNITEYFYENLTGQRNKNIDSTINFRLSRVTAEQVTTINSPTTLSLMMCVLMVWLFSRKHGDRGSRQ